MGLFDKLFHKKSDEDDIDLNEYVGMRLEIMDGSQSILFVARANLAYDGELELQPMGVPKMPPYADNIPVYLRGYDEMEKKPIYLQGTLVSRGKGKWIAEDLRLTSIDTERSSFRQDVSGEGEITPMKRWGLGTSTCRLINISAGGICFWSDVALLPGERVLLKADILDQWSIKPQICVIRRATKRRYGYEYGCEFVALPTSAEETIYRGIMDLQRQNREARQSGR